MRIFPMGIGCICIFICITPIERYSRYSSRAKYMDIIAEQGGVGGVGGVVMDFCHRATLPV